MPTPSENDFVQSVSSVGSAAQTADAPDASASARRQAQGRPAQLRATSARPRRGTRHRQTHAAPCGRSVRATGSETGSD